MEDNRSPNSRPMPRLVSSHEWCSASKHSVHHTYILDDRKIACVTTNVLVDIARDVANALARMGSYETLTSYADSAESFKGLDAAICALFDSVSHYHRHVTKVIPEESEILVSAIDVLVEIKKSHLKPDVKDRMRLSVALELAAALTLLEGLMTCARALLSKLEDIGTVADDDFLRSLRNLTADVSANLPSLCSNFMCSWLAANLGSLSRKLS